MPFDLDHIDTVVLAGARSSAPAGEAQTSGYTALVELGGKPAICHLLDALRAAPEVRRICIAGPEALLRPKVEAYTAAGTAYDFVSSGETLMESIYSGLSHFADSPMALPVTANMPLLTPRAIRDFLVACAPVESGFAQNFFFSVVPQLQLYRHLRRARARQQPLPRYRHQLWRPHDRRSAIAGKQRNHAAHQQPVQ